MTDSATDNASQGQGASAGSQTGTPPLPDPTQGAAVVDRIERDAAGRVIVHLQGSDEPVEDARIARCFPWSLPDVFISIRNAEGKEIALLRSTDELDPGSRAVVEADLQEKIFNPHIRRVLSYKSEFGVISVTAETDRGEVTFQIRGRDDVRPLSEGRLLFRDVDGNTYELPDAEQLDKTSRKHLSEFL